MSYSLSPLLKPRFFVNATNKPLVGGKLYTYLAETTTPATTYSNDTGTPNTNPIILDANGECNLYLDDDVSYRLILKDANDVTYFDKDRVSSIGGGDYKVLTFNTIADLRLKIGSEKEPVAQTSGYYAAGDGGGNTFYWDGTSSATDNGGTIIKPTYVSGAGRWLAIDAYTINVRQFGAKGDGSTDNTTAIQAAITASNTVYFPDGTYLFSGITINTHNVTLYGAGESRSVLLMTTAAATAITIASTAFTSGVNIRNLRIEGNASNLGGISLGTTTNAAARIRIQDVFITGFQNAANGYGIRLNSNQNTDIENLWIQECYFGIYRANGGYSTSTRFSGKGSYFGRNCLHGIYVDGQCDDLYIQDGLVEGCLGVGIAVTANAAYTTGAGRGTRLILDSVYFEENNKDGLSSYNAIHVIGTGTGYAQHTLTVNDCQFAANPSAPVGVKNVGLDWVIAYFNNNRLIPSEVVPTANCSVKFSGNTFPNAGNYLSDYKAMLGNVIASDFTSAYSSTDPNQVNFVNAITFPATNRPVNDPNTLDDYQEGTWTTTLSGVSGTGISTITEYTKIGRLLNFKIIIQGTGVSSAGTAQATLPFAVNGTAFNCLIATSPAQTVSAGVVSSNYCTIPAFSSTTLVIITGAYTA